MKNFKTSKDEQSVSNERKSSKRIALIVFMFIASMYIGSSYVFAQPTFNKNSDILMMQFDAGGDEDDIHCMAAFACMKLHPDLDGVNEYIVTGARLRTATTGAKGHELLTDLFGPQGTEEWTSAWDNWTLSVNRVRDKVKPIIQAGGRVWVAEGGQSDFTADWLRALNNDGISLATLKTQVVVVQHSVANENFGTQSDLTYVKNNTEYYKIADGNSTGNGTAGYATYSTNYYTDARSSSNPNASARTIWNHCHDFLPIPDPNIHNPYMDGGGVDFSDISETWWILDLGPGVDNVSEFWNRYVVNTPPSGSCTSTGIQWDMNSLSEFGNNPSGSVSNLSVSGGILSYSVSGNDPFVYSADNLGYCTSSNSQIEIRIKNGTSLGNLKIYFTTNSSTGFSESKSVAINTTTNDAVFKVYTLNMNSNSNWTGTLKRLRLDVPEGNSGGTVEVDYIRLGNTNQNPVVSFNTPSNNATFSAPANISVDVSATDDGSISNVRLYLNGTFVRQENAAPYTWGGGDPALNNMAAGNYSLRAVATDNNGNMGESTINITVGQANQNPVVSFNTPSNNASFSAPANVSVDVNATDDGSIANVQLFLNGTFVRQENAAPYTWGGGDPALNNMAAGTYALRAVATDNNGLTGEETINITVQSAGPTVSFTQPTQTQFNAGDDLGVVAYASDGTTNGQNISNVRLSFNGQLVRQENAAPYEWGTANPGQTDAQLYNLTAGTHQLSLVATNTQGVSSTATMTINVAACNDDLPWSDADFNISATTVNYNSGAIDISCASNATLSLDIAGVIGSMETNQDYLTVSYSVDGGSPVTIANKQGNFNAETLSVTGISGSTLVLYIDGYTSVASEVYEISNISVVEGGAGARHSSVSKTIAEKEVSDNMVLYPNPAEGFVNLSLGKPSETAIVEIYNTGGSIVLRKTVTGGESTLNINALGSGLYVVKVSFGEILETRKLYIK